MTTRMKNKAQAMREVCPGCGAPVKVHEEECRYCHRPYDVERPKNILPILAVAGSALVLAISLAVKINVDMHIGGSK